MRVGVAEVDITPAVGAELSGFAARTQPSIGVLDPLFARCLYLESPGERLVWLHADVIGLPRDFVGRFRRWAGQELGIEPARIMLSATHTHAGPATLLLQEAGRYDAAYVEQLHLHLGLAARQAIANTEECAVVTAEGRCDLAMDRRRRPTAHTDPSVAAVGWKRSDGAFKAVLLNYPIHPVALGSANRQISADLMGQVAAAAARRMSGHPVVLVTNGACGNLNPPAENVAFSQVQAWAGQIAEAVLPALAAAQPEEPAPFRMASTRVPVPMETLTVAEIDRFAAHALQDAIALGEWGDRFRRAVAHWQETMGRQVLAGQVQATRDAELMAVRIGRLTFVGISAEAFSHFAELVRMECGSPAVYVVGYANGVMGYLPTQAAYLEGGYEVETAHVFYLSFRPRRGALEMLARQAAELVRELR